MLAGVHLERRSGPAAALNALQRRRPKKHKKMAYSALQISANSYIFNSN
jgi:hypothetical protein